MKMPSLDDVIKIGTFIVSIPAYVLPPIYGEIFFGSLNPAIIEDVWGITVAAMPLGGLGFYALSVRDGSPRRPAAAFAVIGFLALIALMLAVRRGAIPLEPEMSALALRYLVILIFFFGGAIIGSAVAQVPAWLSKARAPASPPTP
jgi:hypothetical protein